MRKGVVRLALDGAAARVVAQVRPVPALVGPEHLAEPDPGRGGCGTQRVDYWRDQPAGPEPGQHGQAELLPGQHADRVPGDVRGGLRVRRVGKVIAEAKLDALPWRGDPEYHHAAVRPEPDQVRDHREQGSRGIHLDTLHLPLRRRDQRTGPHRVCRERFARASRAGLCRTCRTGCRRAGRAGLRRPFSGGFRLLPRATL